MNDPTDTNLVDEMIANFRETHQRFMEEADRKRAERLEALRKAMPLHLRAGRRIQRQTGGHRPSDSGTQGRAERPRRRGKAEGYLATHPHTGGDVSERDWIEYGKPWEEFARDEAASALGEKGNNLAVPGTRVEVGGEVYLIGDINTRRGVCECCPEFRRSAIVTRYLPPRSTP